MFLIQNRLNYHSKRAAETCTEGVSPLESFFCFNTNQIPQERREHSDWLESFEQHKATTICGNQVKCIEKGKHDYQDGLTRQTAIE